MKTRSNWLMAIALAFSASLPIPLSALASEAMEKPADALAMSTGEVRKIDKEAAKITIKHGPLTNLDMPPMTMVFRISDPAMLDQVQPGDQIKFVAERVSGALIVTKMEYVK